MGKQETFLAARKESCPTALDRSSSEHPGAFPPTQWTVLGALRVGTIGTRNETLNRLITLYWKPVYYYVRRKGHDDEAAKNLVQEFFTDCLDRQTFTQADASRGRFRTFLLACLGNFLKNVHRAAHAKKRCPTAGIVPLDDVICGDSVVFEPRDQETPEAVFHRAWIQDLLMRVLLVLEQECRATGKAKHYEIFRLRIVEPILHGAESPPMSDLASRLGLTEKNACNCLLTVRRAYQRLLREEIRQYALSDEDVAAEVRDLFHFLGASG